MERYLDFATRHAEFHLQENHKLESERPRLTGTPGTEKGEDGLYHSDCTCSVHGHIGSAVLNMQAIMPGGESFQEIFCLRCCMDYLCSLPIARLGD